MTPQTTLASKPLEKPSPPVSPTANIPPQTTPESKTSWPPASSFAPIQPFSNTPAAIAKDPASTTVSNVAVSRDNYDYDYYENYSEAPAETKASKPEDENLTTNTFFEDLDFTSLRPMAPTNWPSSQQPQPKFSTITEPSTTTSTTTTMTTTTTTTTTTTPRFVYKKPEDFASVSDKMPPCQESLCDLVDNTYPL